MYLIEPRPAALQLAADTVGTGEPLIILHGLFGSRGNWRYIARQLSGHAQVISADLRNHGQSPHHDSMSLADMTADVCALLSSQGLESTDLMGHSLGGRVAMYLALRYPQRVRSLLVGDNAPVTYRSSQAGIAAALASLPLASLENRQDADRLLAMHLPNTPLRQFLLQNLVRGEGGWRWRCNLPAIQAHLDSLRHFPDPPGAQVFAGPCLFLRGERSDYVLDAHLPEIRARFPKALVQTIPEAGHWPHAEQPERFLQAVRDFF